MNEVTIVDSNYLPYEPIVDSKLELTMKLDFGFSRIRDKNRV